MKSNKYKNLLGTYYNKETQILHQSYDDEIDILKYSKNSIKSTLRIAIMGEGEQVGIAEWIVGSSKYISSVKWVSK